MSTAQQPPSPRRQGTPAQGGGEVTDQLQTGMQLSGNSFRRHSVSPEEVRPHRRLSTSPEEAKPLVPIHASATLETAAAEALFGPALVSTATAWLEVQAGPDSVSLAPGTGANDSAQQQDDMFPQPSMSAAALMRDDGIVAGRQPPLTMKDYMQTLKVQQVR